MMDSLNEFQLIDKLAIQLGIASPESQEERNTSSLYQRAVLRAAIGFMPISQNLKHSKSRLEGAAE